MTLNPPNTNRPTETPGPRERSRAREQDIEELREDLAAASEETQEFPKAQLKELILLEGGIDPADRERPYLRRLPDQYAARLTLFEWLQFALDTGGSRHTLEALDYYTNIGWINETVASTLRDHVRMFQNGTGETDIAPFDTADHLVSLVYIARLASMT